MRYNYSKDALIEAPKFVQPDLAEIKKTIPDFGLDYKQNTPKPLLEYIATLPEKSQKVLLAYIAGMAAVPPITYEFKADLFKVLADLSSSETLIRKSFPFSNANTTSAFFKMPESSSTMPISSNYEKKSMETHADEKRAQIPYAK